MHLNIIIIYFNKWQSWHYYSKITILWHHYNYLLGYIMENKVPVSQNKEKNYYIICICGYWSCLLYVTNNVIDLLSIKCWKLFEYKKKVRNKKPFSHSESLVWQHLLRGIFLAPLRSPQFTKNTIIEVMLYSENNSN